MSDHSYDRRWNLHYDGHSIYTDDTADVLDRIARGKVKFVAEGHADYEYLDDGRTMITRRTKRWLTPEEFVEEFGART
jgi:hypothetical protein